MVFFIKTEKKSLMFYTDGTRIILNKKTVSRHDEKIRIEKYFEDSDQNKNIKPTTCSNLVNILTFMH